MKLIRFVLIASLSVSFGSCQKIKEWSKKRTRIVEHHYHDSTFNIQKETITERWLPADTTSAHFDLEALLRSGYGKSTDRYFTTEIRYIDNGLTVTTTIDSLMERIRSLERSQGTIQVNTDKKEDVTDKTKEVTVTSYWWILGPIATVIIILLIAYLWRRFIRWNPIGLK